MVQLPSGSIGTSSISTPFCRMTILSGELVYDSSPANSRSTQVLRPKKVSDCGVDGRPGLSVTITGAGRPANSCPQNAGSGGSDAAIPRASRIVIVGSSPPALARSEIQDCLARGLDVLHYVFDLRGADLQLFQSFLEDRGYPVEMPRLQPLFVELAQIDAAVLVRTAKGHGEKGFMLEPLSRHIDIVEESPDEVVREELAVEQIDRDVYRLVATDPVVERDVFQLEIIPLLRGEGPVQCVTGSPRSTRSALANSGRATRPSPLCIRALRARWTRRLWSGDSRRGRRASPPQRQGKRPCLRR